MPSVRHAQRSNGLNRCDHRRTFEMNGKKHTRIFSDKRKDRDELQIAGTKDPDSGNGGIIATL